MKSRPLLILLLTATTTLARLGETQAQCEARYGKPIHTTALGNTLYRKAGLDIAIHFWNDKAATLFIVKSRPGAKDFDDSDPEWSKREPLSQAEIDTLLKANAAGSTWEKDNTDPFAKGAWKRADHTATATYNTHRLELRDETAHAQIAKHHAEELTTLARLGETKAECEKRFGKPIYTSEDGGVVHRKAGFIILVHFLKDKSAQLMFVKSELGLADLDPEDLDPITPDELALIVKGIAGNTPWVEEGFDKEDDMLRWHRPDEKALAAYNFGARHLLIYTQEYSDHLANEEEGKEADKAERETKKLDGF